jgi:esterase/lipase
MAFADKNSLFIGLLHQANKVTRLFNKHGIFPFKENTPEHPDINYCHIPIRALHQLKKLMSKCEVNFNINCPIHFLHADEDPLIKTSSIDVLMRRFGNNNTKTLIQSKRHGIVFDDIDNTQQKIIDWVSSQSKVD